MFEGADPQKAEATLAAIGLSKTQARAYETPVDHPGLSADDIAHALKRPRREVEEALVHLTQIGMASHSVDRVARYHVMPPDLNGSSGCADS